MSNIHDAIEILKKCTNSDVFSELAKMTLAALKAYLGDTHQLSKLYETNPLHPYVRSFKWVLELNNRPKIFFNRWDVFDFAISKADPTLPFYEFGVWRGVAFRYLMKTFSKGYGFDTFTGLPEDWHNEKRGTYTSDNNIPDIPGAEFIVGKFEDTLPAFFRKDRPVASLINFDADLYSSTICALTHCKPIIGKDTILVFDEFLINPNFEEDEMKALYEFCVNNSYEFEVLAFSFFSKQAVIKLSLT